MRRFLRAPLTSGSWTGRCLVMKERPFDIKLFRSVHKIQHGRTAWGRHSCRGRTGSRARTQSGTCVCHEEEGSGEKHDAAVALARNAFVDTVEHGNVRCTERNRIEAHNVGCQTPKPMAVRVSHKEAWSHGGSWIQSMDRITHVEISWMPVRADG